MGVICSSERTGNYLLSDALSSIGIAGRPEEFFRPAILAPFLKEVGTAIYIAYFQQVLVEGMTKKQADEASEVWVERYLQLKHSSKLLI